MEYQLTQVAKLYDWNGSLAASVTDALSEAGLDDTEALYFVSPGRYYPLIAVGTEAPVDTHRNIHRVYSEQRRITIPKHLAESGFNLSADEVVSSSIRLAVFAGDGFLAFKKITSSELSERILKKIRRNFQQNLWSNNTMFE